MTFDDKMFAKGYLYKLRALDGSIEPLYAKTLAGVAQLLRDYKTTKFCVSNLQFDNRIIGLGGRIIGE